MKKHLPLWIMLLAAIVITGFAHSRQGTAQSGVSTSCGTGLCSISTFPPTAK